VTRHSAICLLISSLLLAPLPGCSFLFVHGPPENHAALTTFQCSESNAWPVLDGIWSLLNGLGALTAAGDDNNPDQGQIVAVGLSWFVVSGISAIYGFSKVSDCNKARQQRDERYAYPPPGPVPAPYAPPRPSPAVAPRPAVAPAPAATPPPPAVAPPAPPPPASP